MVEQNMEVSKLRNSGVWAWRSIDSAMYLSFPSVSNQRRRTRVDKVNAELVTLTYGTIVAQLCQDYDNNYQEVNKQLDKMGYNIGMRLIEDFLAKSGVGRCANFRETADMIAKVGVFILWDIYRLGPY